MDLFRVFDWDGKTLGKRDGGPLFVPRERQGAGRHDAPALYGAWYCSRQAMSAVAESLQYLRGQDLEDGDFLRAGTSKALVGLRLNAGLELVDLDDPVELTRRHTRPSQVATLRRAVTQATAVSIFEAGAAGLLWWSVLEAEWTNVTLFHERALPHTTIATPPRLLSTRMIEVREACERMGIRI